MAVHDHFSAKSNAALSEIHTIASEADPSSATEDLKDIMSITQQAIPFTPTEDLWSLQYITVHRAQPLMEALDDDGSSFITVNEVNEFTASRPEGWRCVLLVMKSGMSTDGSIACRGGSHTGLSALR